MHWMNAYRDGRDVKDTKIEVKKFSSMEYSSHHQVTEAWGRKFDSTLLTK